MIDCGLSHDAIMDALNQPHGRPPTDTHVTCLLISKITPSQRQSQTYDSKPHKLIVKSLKAIYDTSLRRSRDGHFIELPFQKNHILFLNQACSSTHNQSKIEQKSSWTATISHSEESESTCLNLEESNEEFVSLTQNRPFTLFESLIDYMMDNIQFTYSMQDTGCDSIFQFCFKTFGQALKETNLTLLDLGGSQVGNDMFLGFVKQLKGTQIVSINLPRPEIYYNYEKSFTKDLATCSINNVRIVDENGIDITVVPSFFEKAQSLESLSLILKDTQISSLDFSYNSMNLKMLSTLIGSKITCLGLKGCNIQQVDLSCLARILKDTQIASIDFSHNGLACASMEILAPGLAQTKITSLNFNCNRIGNYGIRCLGSVLKNTHITSIDISNNAFGSYGFNMFVNFLVDSKINSLYLKGNDIGVNNLNSLGRVLRNTQITAIDLSALGVNYESLNALSAGLVGSKIKLLNLSDNWLDDLAAIHCLGRILRNTNRSS